MKPAFSVVFLTTLIGMGQGLFVALYSSQIMGWVDVTNHSYYAFGAILSLICLLSGLIASFFHLGRPERAWRAATMWRTSWLSREVIVLPLTMLMVSIYAYCHFKGSSASMIVGGIGMLTVVALFVCTAMIYACIKFLQEWATPLTVINFTLLGLSSGFVLAAVHASYFQLDSVTNLIHTALILLGLSLIFKLASLWRNNRIKPKSTTQTALGIRHNKIKQQSVGFMGGSFNTKAFFHGQPKTVIKLAKVLMFLWAFLLPATMLFISSYGAQFFILLFALIIMYIGLIIERWHFFVQANHPQNLYYQSD